MYEGKLYESWRTVLVDGKPLDLRLDLAYYRAGFAWGSGENGSSQLALAIVSNHFRTVRGMEDSIADQVTLQCYQDFKVQVIEKLDMDQGWSLSDDDVEEVLLRIEEVKGSWHCHVCRRAYKTIRHLTTHLERPVELDCRQMREDMERRGE